MAGLAKDSARTRVSMHYGTYSCPVIVFWVLEPCLFIRELQGESQDADQYEEHASLVTLDVLNFSFARA